MSAHPRSSRYSQPATLADHSARIESQEKRLDRIEGKLDRIVWFQLFTLAAVIGALIQGFAR